MEHYKAGMIAGMLALLLAGCAVQPSAPGTASAPEAVGGGDSSRNALDWAGAYRGILPCADCEGIETNITLNTDGSYVAKTRYLGKSGEVLASQGKFSWDASGGIITLDGGEPAKYRVGENRLIRLAMDGSPVTGALAEKQVLTKMTQGMTEKYWKLVELNGKPVPTLQREPHLILKTDENRAVGFGGCNNFTGSYTLDEATLRIRFNQMASTMMACSQGMDVESAFHEVLAQADNYSLSGDSMTLNRARMAPLARFEAVYMR